MGIEIVYLLRLQTLHIHLPDCAKGHFFRAQNVHGLANDWYHTRPLLLDLRSHLRRQKVVGQIIELLTTFTSFQRCHAKSWDPNVSTEVPI